MTISSPVKNLTTYLPPDEVLSQCIHCGLCLAVCPTYDITKLERSSPRGRIKMIKSVTGGEAGLSDIFIDEMNFCLDCQACETACPAGVKYGNLVEAARVVINDNRKSHSLIERVKKYFLNEILSNPVRLKFYSRLLRIYQKSILKNLVEKYGLLKLFPGNLNEAIKLAPCVSAEFSSDFLDELTEPEGDIKFRTAFHTGCIMDTSFAEINMDTVDVLKAFGCSVFTPGEQVCCGSLHGHNGEIEKARELARKNIAAFEKSGYEYLVSNSAGCGAYMKGYGELLKGDCEYKTRAESFASKVVDVTEFLCDKTPVRGFRQLNMSVSYHDACHLVHSQKIYNEPRELLSRIPGLEVIDLEDSTRCCGSAGIYNVMRYDDSMKILEDKMKTISRAQATTVVTGNPGCIIQLTHGAEKFNTRVHVLHPVSLLKRAIY